MLAHVLRDGLKEMGLAEAGAAVDEERVVGLRRRFGHGQRGRVREAVRRADHERVERVLRVEPAALGPSRQALDHGKEAFLPRAVLRRRLALVGHPELDRALVADDVADGSADQAEEMSLDPVARELARDGEDERLAVELEAADVAEPLAVRPVVEGFLEPPGDAPPRGPP